MYYFVIFLFLILSTAGYCLEPGVKAIGLTGAYNAIADDNSAIELNPGGIAQVKHYEIDINYLTSDLSTQWRFAVLDSVSSPLAMGLSYSQIEYKENAEPLEIREFGASSLTRAQRTTIAVGSGSDYFFAGINAEYNKIQDNPKDYFWTFAGGAIVKPVPQLLNLSFTLHNFATAGSDNHSVLRKWSAGISTYLNYLLASASWSKMEDSVDLWSFGVEGYLPQQIAIRSGYFRGKAAKDEGYAFGISWRIQQLGLNYSYQKRYNDKLHSISLSIGLF